MATEAQIDVFLRSGDIGESYPYHEYLPQGIIREWTPEPRVGDHHLRLAKDKELGGDDNSWYGFYTDLGVDWTDRPREFLENIKLKYEKNGSYLYTRDIPPELFPDPNDWKIIEFGVAKFISGNLISRILWEKTQTKARYMSAYSWPGC